MDFYDEIRQCFDHILDKTSSKEEFERITTIFKTESGKELYLIVAEWLSEHDEIGFEAFRQFSILFRLHLDGLRKANKFIMNEYLDVLYIRCMKYTEEQIVQIYNVFNTPFMEEATQPYLYFMISIAPTIQQEIASQITKPEDIFSDLPYCMQISIARAAVFNPQQFRSYGLERLATLLLNNTRTCYKEDGITLCSQIKSPENAIKLFNNAISAAPYLCSAQSAKKGWEICLLMLHNMTTEDRFHSIRISFENKNITDSARISLTNELIKQIRNGQGTIFRSPSVIQIAALICNPSILSSPVTHSEVVISIFAFLTFIVTLERKYRCFMLLGCPSEKELRNSIEITKKGINESEKQNNRPKEEILKNMKKSNFGENMTMDDVEKAVKSTQIIIARIKFAISEFESILN
ncbi:hypothetical protein TVAG_250000 [Trichomonas vaginalis G3]|uniref:Uncharacterized protein n=1 Tax=Trichomonas vaginalis (strain ATCC PRA-98 / G3) TaxID=412133 RepID=A2DCK3_TRIV3|nr:hypothetical protein TVAGG3_0956350 [Trichomonas vaginalis G3]EAY21940.1 hypothetical protein TVAG_250000 [Trichomonas vaginalis G3]KAI5487584.1 hypothetical protein TVAGG3_0956350 [Trichomonas vaginalis G3]|eukprot:XP_001582926.1 hypothetical protein [Trichomonas vaginalis G3]